MENLDWGAANDNGNLNGVSEYNGGPGYPAFLAFGRSYTYDGTGMAPIPETVPLTNAYDAATNRIQGQSYDAAGNVLQLAWMSFTYDAESRQKTAVLPGVNTETYLYDGEGRRVEKIPQSGLSTVYVYDAFGQIASEYTLSTGETPPCHTCYLTWDHLGSTRLVTDQAANIVARHDYLPFGEEIPAGVAGRDTTFSASDFVNQKFTGKERDQESGLDYFGARYMSSAQGRFTSPDDVFADQHPDNPQTWNLYSYVRNNPLSMFDPTGRDALWVHDKDTGQITLVIPVRITGSAATAEDATTIVNRDNTLNLNGSSVNIKVVATDKPINGVLNKMDFSPGYDTKMCGAAGECVNKLGGDKAHINSDNAQSTDAAAHDVLHFAGIKDEYVEGPRDAQGNRTSTPAPGYDDSNIMTSRSGTNLKPEQVQQANKNQTTKHCTTQDGKTTCSN